MALAKWSSAADTFYDVIDQGERSGCSAGSTPSANSAFAPLPSLAVTTNSAAPSCQDSVLSLAGPLDGWGGVSQIQQITFQVTNRGGTTCALDGYPSVRLYGSGASNYTYRYGDPTGHFQSSKPPSRVVIASHGSAYFQVARRTCASPEANSYPSTLRVTMPGGTSTFVEPLTTWLHSLPSCTAGSSDYGSTVTTSPIRTAQGIYP
jgi:hypothetical protein